MNKIVIVWGTRPEAIKLAPVAEELERLEVEHTYLCTGQHTSLLNDTAARHLLEHGSNLSLPSNEEKYSLWVAKAVPKVTEALKQSNATHVVVQGDTMSALAGAEAAHRLGLPLAHIEAGLRSGDEKNPEPEEFIRKAITRYTDLHLAPTPQAANNLMEQHVPWGTGRKVVVTGNTVVSALAQYLKDKPQPPDNTIYITMHRNEWRAKGARHILSFLDAAQDWARNRRVFLSFIAHPSIQPTIEKHLFQANHLFLTYPTQHKAMIRLVRSSLGIVTDSGGLQEECAVLGVPCAVMRTVSDRPESIQAGFARRFRPDAYGVKEALDWIVEYNALGKSREGSDCYGTVDAAFNVAKALKEWSQ